MEQPISQGRKVALLGTATTSVHDAPYHDETWEIWSLSANFLHKNRFTRWFELHTYATLEANLTVPEYLTFLKACGNRLMVGHASEHWPQAQLYPIDAVTERFRFDDTDCGYFTSSCSYMLALVLHEHLLGQTVSDLGLWGIDMAQDGEYKHQRPCVEHYLGIARGLGIRLHMAPESPLLRTPARYAFDYLKLSREMTQRFNDSRVEADRLRVASLEAEKKYYYAMGNRDAIKSINEYWNL